ASANSRSRCFRLARLVSVIFMLIQACAAFDPFLYEPLDQHPYLRGVFLPWDLCFDRITQFW
ncbi:MAG: hypothetical protein OEZ15_09615, partial [Gammaproteobacteria bacterium]|nr:hypothetical protein [Gammaproteobacteria bacterium]